VEEKDPDLFKDKSTFRAKNGNRQVKLRELFARESQETTFCRPSPRLQRPKGGKAKKERFFKERDRAQNRLCPRGATQGGV